MSSLRAVLSPSLALPAGILTVIVAASLLVTPILIFWIAYRQRQRVLVSTET